MRADEIRGGRRSVVTAALALAIAVAAGACSQKKPDDKPADKADGVEVSYTGYVSKTYPGDLVGCGSATKSALQKLNVSVANESGGVFKETLSGSSSDGTSITVKIAELSKTATRISVKVGYFLGDEDAGRRILSEIDAELGPRRASSGGTFGGFSTFSDLLKPTPAGPAR
jgi:hypothetical protein